MVKCKECGGEVSTKAASCPKCGAPVKRKSGGIGRLLAWGIGGAFLLVFVFGLLSPDGGNVPAPTPTVAPAAPRLDKSPAMQARREKLISELQAKGLIDKVECRPQGGDLWVTPAYMILPFDDKMSFASAVYAYCFDGSDQYVTLRLVNDRDGKSVGAFSAALGLKMD